MTGLAGTFIGGGLLSVIPQLNLQGFAVYRMYFSFVLLANAIALAVVLRLKPLKDRKVTEVLGMMFSVRDWRAIYSVQKLSQIPELERTEDLLDGLAALGSDVSEKTLLRYLDNPLFTVRAAALEALRAAPLSSSASRRLIDEVAQGEFTTAFLAAEILGQQRIQSAVMVLRNCLNSADFFLQGKAMVALAQLGDKESFAVILRLFNETGNPRLLIHGARAIAYMGMAENIPCLLQKLDATLPQTVCDEMLCSASALLGRLDEHFHLVSLFNRKPQLGLDALEYEWERGMENASGSAEKLLIAVKSFVMKSSHRGEIEAEGLLELLEQLCASLSERIDNLNVLLADEGRLVKLFSPRLRFSLAAFMILLVLWASPSARAVPI